MRTQPELSGATAIGSRRASDWRLAARLLRELGPQRAWLVVATALYLPLVATQLVQPLIIGVIVDRGYRAHDLDAVAWWSLLYLASVLARVAVETGQSWLLQSLGIHAVTALRARLFAKIQRLPMSYLDKTPLGKLVTRVTSDTESVAELFATGSVSIVGDAVFLVGTLVLLFVVDVPLSLGVLAVMPVLVIGVAWFRRRTRAAFTKVRALLATMNATLQEQLSGMAVVQLFAQSARMRGRFEEQNHGYMMANREAIALDAGVFSFVDAMATVAVAVALAVGAGLADAGALTLGTLVLFIEALGRFFLPVRELSNKTTVIQSGLVAAERIIELEAEPELIEVPAAPVPARFLDELRFSDVRFAYGDGPEVLKGLSLVVKRGQRVALVGLTGAGKSTVLKLLPRLYDVGQGRITIDGVDLRQLDPRELRRLTVAVPQDVFLFAGTIGDNLRMGRLAATDAEVQAALEACQALDVVEAHGGLSGRVLERGQNFSLGERQLLALARALLADPPILLLDEATASVDRFTERKLQLATERLLAGRTAVVVAHRLSTVEQADQILVLDEGAVVEQGTHQELIAAGGLYARFVELQRLAEE
ncbi:MAG: ABC transporter ATP-binding protein [Deltaproteobacteria bacterium]|nr:ABC transporter ATP-binding protein [Deltaproteobacteria bacterium]